MPTMESEYLKFMRNRSKILLLVFNIILFNTQVGAQVVQGYYNDALRLSQTTFGGSARFQGLGGATTALGADIGSLSSNPAGLGMYNRSDMNFSLGGGLNHSKSDFMGNSENGNKGFFNIPGGGLVFSGPKDDTTRTWKGGTFGFGVTCINNFQNRFKYTGENSQSNFTDYLIEQTNGTVLNKLYLTPIDKIKDIPGLAYYSFLVNPVDDSNLNNTQYNSFITGDTVRQEETVVSKGRQYQYDIAYAGNINDKLYIGASLGIVTVKYVSNREYKETVLPTDTLISYIFFDNRKLKGTGVNFKLGMIYKVADWLRIGGSILTPTSYSLKETRTYKTETNFINLDNTPFTIDEVDSAKAVPDPYRYHLNTPFKFSGGLAVFAGKKGFISADISYLNYKMTGLKGSSGKSIEGDNRFINDFYKSSLNFNLGGEYRKEALRLRAGFGYYGNPYKQGSVNGSIKSISLGAGLRYSTHYLDVAYVYSVSKSNYKPYTLNDGTEPSVSIKNSNSRLIATFGILF
jgi:hypothetical protein